MLTYEEIVDDIYEYYTECFMNELEETTIRNYEAFVDNLIDDIFCVNTYNEVFESTYDYRDINMPTTIRMMNFIMEYDAEQYTLLAEGARAIISVFAFYIVREAINGDLNRKDDFNYHWKRRDEDTMFGA